MKTIRFNNCNDCPCKQVQYEEDEITYKINIHQICSRYKYNIIPDINIIPEWCPVPDDKKE